MAYNHYVLRHRKHAQRWHGTSSDTKKTFPGIGIPNTKNKTASAYDIVYVLDGPLMCICYTRETGAWKGV